MSTQFLFKTAPDQPNFATEVAQRAFEPARPYPQNPQVIVYRTRFMQLRAYYTRPAANTPHPDLPQVYFADDIDFQDRTSGLVEWTRVYTTLPTSWNDFASESYSYPGILWLVGPASRGRNPFSHIVTTKITRDYYAVGNFAAFQSNATNYDDPSAAGWSKNGVTANGNASAIPQCAGGTNAAALIAETATNAVHLLATSSSPTLPAGLTTGCIFLKSGTRSTLGVYIKDSGANTAAFCNVDLSTGQITNSNAINCAVTAIGDGWWRVSLIGNSAASNPQVWVYSLNGVDGATSFQGATGNYYYAWRGQIINSNIVPAATVPPTLAGDGNTNYPIASADLIPVKFGTQFLYNPNVALGSNIAIEYLSNGSSPNYSTYNGWQIADAANSNSYSIESQDSTQSLWYGAIWERQRRFVKAI